MGFEWIFSLICPSRKIQDEIKNKIGKTDEKNAKIMPKDKHALNKHFTFEKNQQDEPLDSLSLKARI